MSKSKKNPILLIVIIVVIIAIGVGVYFLVKSKEPYEDISNNLKCEVPGMCGFEKQHEGKDWCWTDQNNDKWKNCDVDESKSPWKECKDYLRQPNQTGISDKCLNALWKNTGCAGTYIDDSASESFRTWAKSKTIKEIILDNNKWYQKGCGDRGIIKVPDIPVNQIETDIDKNIALVKNEISTFSKDKKDIDKPVNTIQCLKRILNIENKADDKIKATLSDDTDLKSYKNIDIYIMEIVKSRLESIQRLTGEYIKKGVSYDEAVEKATKQANDGLRDAYQTVKCKGIVKSALVEDEIIKKFELEIKEQTGVDVTTVDCTEPYVNGISYDSDGNLREYSRSRNRGCYLVTALTKNNLLSIVQVYQIRKVMLEAFKDESNHKFFHFYLSHFQKIADFLEQTGRLSEIVPDVTEVVELSKRGEMKLAFEKWISIARKAYQMCKDMKLDVSEMEKKWNNLKEIKLNGLPEPNKLFVEEPFRKVFRHFGTVC